MALENSQLLVLLQTNSAIFQNIIKLLIQKHQQALIGAPQKPKILSPDLQYLAQNVSSNLGGVRVEIEGERIILDCMTEDFRDQTLEKLSQ